MKPTIVAMLMLTLTGSLIGCGSSSTKPGSSSDPGTTAKLDAVYYDSENDQNQIVIVNGIYFIEHEHFTEKGTIVVAEGSDTYTFTIKSGDAEGAPPYKVQIEKLGDKKYAFYKNRAPMINSTGIYLRSDDPTELKEYADQAK